MPFGAGGEGLGQQTLLVSLCTELKDLGCERRTAFRLGERIVSVRVQFAVFSELSI